MLILGIDTSCDDTCVALVETGRKVMGHLESSQVEIHADYGGVVPELASRAHLNNLPFLTKQLLDDAGIDYADLDGIGVTYGPGLVGCLLVGLSFAKGLALETGLPWVGINHLEGHLYSVILAAGDELTYPHLALLVSGGHTLLYRVNGVGEYEKLGSTHDDAAGEAFDKVGKFLGLPFPGGPAIEKIAREWDGELIEFPQPRVKDGGKYDWSFSGLKTAVINYSHNRRQKGETIEVPQVAASFQKAAVEALVTRTLKAAEDLGIDLVTCTGGVACNQYLRDVLTTKAEPKKIKVFAPPRSFCTDNGVMIAGLAYHKLKNEEISPWNLNAKPQLRL